MAIMEFKPEDAMQSVTMEAGIYPCLITAIDGPKPSSTQKSVSFFTKFQISAGKYQSKVVEAAFNTGTQTPSMMGAMQFFPFHNFLQVEAAIKNKKVEIIAQKIDSEALVNQPFCIQIGIVPDATGGRLLNMILGFLPKGAEISSLIGGSHPF